MEWNQPIETLVQWGRSIRNIDWEPFYRKIEQSNPWFTRDNVTLALNGIQQYLDSDKLSHWLQAYHFRPVTPKTIGIIMAGNIPLVGIHDLICCYLAGHRAIVKPSSQDNILIKALLEHLSGIDKDLKNKIDFAQNRNAFRPEALIATGSDNTSRYFRHQFSHIPTIIRSNRTSVGVIRGDENKSQLQDLGHDIYSYFGRGCRNVSKLIVPVAYDFGDMINCNQEYQSLLQNAKYRDNYQYQKALYLTQQHPIIDTGYSLIVNNQAVVSPLSTLYFDYYDDPGQLEDDLAVNRGKIQCVASVDGWFQDSLPFGSLQSPELWDYADGIDTMKFLLDL